MEGRRSQKSDDELRDWMDAQRSKCSTVESTPASTSADVQSTERGSGESVRRPSEQRFRDTEHLQEFMERRRTECTVLESSPAESATDARADTFSRQQGESSLTMFHSLAVTNVHETPDASSAVLGGALTADEVCALRAKVREGGAVSRVNRAQLWQSVLVHPPEDATGSSASPPFDSCDSPPALARLLAGDNALASLTPAFSRKCLAWLPTRPESPEDHAEHERWVFLAMSQTLRYHFPHETTTLARICKDAGHSLAEALHTACNSCGMPMSLRDLIFELPDSEDFPGGAEALLTLCDSAVLEDEMLVFCVAVVLLSQIPDGDFEDVVESMRSAITLVALAMHVDDVASCLERARDVARTTPSSLLALPLGKELLDFPVAAVSAREVLSHTHERPPKEWRFLAVDARMRESATCLPVCLQLPRVQQTKRRQILQETANDEDIHLCLFGDSDPRPGEDAFELCRFLLGPGARRRHISVVKGGWPALEELAKSLQFHLMPTDMGVGKRETPVFGDAATAASDVAAAAGRQARALKSEAATLVSEQVGWMFSWAKQKAVASSIVQTKTHDGEDTMAYAGTNDEEETLWDSFSEGREPGAG